MSKKSSKDLELEKAMLSFSKLQVGCYQLIAQYMRDDKPNALEFFLKQTVKMRTALLMHIEGINQIHKGKILNPTMEVNSIMRNADRLAKRMVFGNPLWDDDCIKPFPKALDELSTDPELWSFINEQREIYINDLIQKEKDKRRMTTLPIDKEEKQESEKATPPSPTEPHSRKYTQGNPDLKQMFKDTVKLFE